MESSLKDSIEAGGSLLNHANAEPFSVTAKVYITRGPGGVRATPCESCRC